MFSFIQTHELAKQHSYTYFLKTCICFLQIEISSKNAEDVINNLTMNVELADKADQIAINFAVITEVIMAQAQTREPSAIPLQQRINV